MPPTSSVRAWKRWGAWKAHLYEGESCSCGHVGRSLRLGFVLASGGVPSELVELTSDAISPHGVPYGPVCGTCLKVFNRARQEGEDELITSKHGTVSTIDVLRVLIKYGPMTCANLGAELWSGGRGAGASALNHRSYGNCSCPFARPAGRMVARMVQAGFAERTYVDHRTLYRVTSAGEREYMRLHAAQRDEKASA
jgi:hypothetical protein